MASTVEVKGLSQLLRNMEQLPRELVSTNGGLVRSALFKSAKRIRDRARDLAPLRTDPLSPKREQLEPPGTLKKNIIAIRDSNPRATGASERYVILGRTKGKPGPLNAFYWKWVELGHYFVPRRTNGNTIRENRKSARGEGGKFIPAKPFLRPAFEQEKQNAVDDFRDSLAAGIQRVVRKMNR